MTRQTTLYAIAFSTIICVGLVTSFVTRHSLDPTEVQPVLATGASAVEPLPQQSNHRVWKALAFQKVLSINDLGQPEIVKADDEGHILVLDWSDVTIRKYSSQGQPIGYYGRGRGKEPGQLISPTDFTTAKPGQVWVTDSDSGITVFDHSGEFLRRISPRATAQRIVHGDGGRFVTMRMTSAPNLWQTYSDDGGVQATFGQLIQEQSQNSISLEGWIEGDGSDKFYYASLYAGLLAAYDFDGERQFFVQTINPLPLPRIQITAQGGKKIADKKAVSSLSISVSDDGIYLLTALKPGEAGRNAIDVYSKTDGSYLYSVEAPESCRQIYFKGGYAYTLREKSVTKWKL